MVLITMKDSQLNWLFIYYFFLYSLIFPPDPVKIHNFTNIWIYILNNCPQSRYIIRTETKCTRITPHCYVIMIVNVHMPCCYWCCFIMDPYLFFNSAVVLFIKSPKLFSRLSRLNAYLSYLKQRKIIVLLLFFWSTRCTRTGGTQ